MKKLLALAILMLLITACSPSPEVIVETVIVEVEMVVTATSEPTIIPTAIATPEPTTPTAIETPIPTAEAVDRVAFKAMAIRVSLEDLHDRPEDYVSQIVRVDYDVFTPPLEPNYYGINYGDDYTILDPIHQYTDFNLVVVCHNYMFDCYEPGLRELVIAGGGSVIVWGQFEVEGAGDEANLLIAAIVELSPEGAQRATREADPLTQTRGSGFYLVGVDIAPGIWRSTSGHDSCYWKVSDKTGKTIKNHFGMSGGTCYISASAYQVQFDDCGQWVYLGQ